LRKDAQDRVDDRGFADARAAGNDQDLSHERQPHSRLLGFSERQVYALFDPRQGLLGINPRPRQGSIHEAVQARSLDGHEVALPTWTAAQAEDWLGRWAMNLMLINVSTRKFRRAVRLPEGDLPVIAGDGTSKSAASRRFVALSAERLAEWMASDLSKLDVLVIQIDGLHTGNDLVFARAAQTVGRVLPCHPWEAYTINISRVSFRQGQRRSGAGDAGDWVPQRPLAGPLCRSL
jgi:hypothetical protein